ncbi:MAG: HAMP domain-containing protein [Actinobacteria bacterium]|nr:HAMP domain-containing protein [Actinomycetota bacterium]
MIAEAVVIGAATLGVGLAAASGLRLMPSVRTQLSGLAVLAVGLPLASVLFSGWVMFHMGADVKILAVSAASAAVALVGALMLARSIVRPLERLGLTARSLAGGNLGARADQDGPREVAQLAGAINTMASDLERLFDARRELIAWASHDLRTPLANMQAMLEAIDDGLAEPDYYVPALHDQVRTLAILVDDLFELAQIDAGALRLELAVAPLDALVESCVRGVEAEARAKGIALETRLDASAPTATIAVDKIQRVILNLLTNALRHTPSDGTVAVHGERRGDEITVTVEDTGDGVSAAERSRMFERFWRADRSRTSPGAGLGLAIARGLVEAHGGRIWAEGRREGGTRVSFTLPADTRRAGTAGAA